MENRYMRRHRSEEFQEEDVWAVIKESETGFKIGESNDLPRSPRSVSRRLPSAARMIPGVQKHQHVDTKESKLVQSSAPVNIPDWSKIYGQSPGKKIIGSSSSSFDHDHDDNDYYHMLGGGAGSDEDNEDNDGYVDDGDNDGRLPPHEWLAKKLARSQISSFSVCEGVGRTLKGRDLSRCPLAMKLVFCSCFKNSHLRFCCFPEIESHKCLSLKVSQHKCTTWCLSKGLYTAEYTEGDLFYTEGDLKSLTSIPLQSTVREPI